MQRVPKAALAVFLTISLAALAGSCAGRKARNDDKPDAAEKQKTAFEAQATDALALARTGAYEEALRDLAAAADASGPGAFRDALLEARAWALFFSGSVEEARAALAEARRAGARTSPGQTVLEFRLAAQDGIASALRFAEAASRPELDRRAALAMAIMTGRADIRDLAFESEAEVNEYATYLAGYALAPEAPENSSAVPARTASDTAPVIVVSEPEAVGADESTVAVARVACRDALARRGRFRVVDSSSRSGAIEELELSLSGATAGETDVAIGGLFSADYVASGSVIKADSGWLVAFTLSSAADGRIVASDFSQAVDHASIIAAAGRFAAALDGLAP